MMICERLCLEQGQRRPRSGRSYVGGIGDIRRTQEMPGFCARCNVAADAELIPIQEINHAYERMLKNDVRDRFVIDLAGVKAGAP